MRRPKRYYWAASAIVAPFLLTLFTIWSVKAFTPGRPIAIAQVEQTTRNHEPPIVWTHWNAQQYALAEESQWLWIGVAGGVIRWDKVNQSYRRYTAVDGLPHKNVYAVAIDKQGNRWFGGDGGVSRLSNTNQWTHFTPANSSLHSTLVDGIAIAADTTLWVSHGLPAGSISRRNPDGSWLWYPSRAVAVAADYALARTVQSANDLWTVTDDAIWVGYWAYNGTVWQNRTPAMRDLPLYPNKVVADKVGGVWVLPNSEGDLFMRWQGGKWSSIPASVSIDTHLNSLAAGANNTLWLGWEARPGPYSSRLAGFTHFTDLSRITDTATTQWVDYPGPVAALLPAAQGVWGAGLAWVKPPSGDVVQLLDTPRFANVSAAILEKSGLLWVHSQYFSPYSWGAWQTLNDQGDAVLAGDRWSLEAVPDDAMVTAQSPEQELNFFANQSSESVSKARNLVTAVERTPAGDLWVAERFFWRVTQYLSPRRYHQGQWIRVPLPDSVPAVFGTPVNDIFAQDERHTWFAYGVDYSAGITRTVGVLHLDDGGTPAEPADDQWQNYPLVTSSPGGVVAVDTLGRPWFGNDGGLYRYENNGWQPMTDAYFAASAICDLTPAAGGVMFVQTAGYRVDLSDDSCDTPSESIAVIQSNEEIYTTGARELVTENYALVRSATHRNQLWTIAPDGAIWYTSSSFYREPAQDLLYRQTNPGLISYTLPIGRADVQSLEVDANNHVWLAAAGSLWRMTARPDFRLDIGSTLWLIEPGGSRQQQFLVASQEGFQQAVTLQLAGLPDTVTATVTPTVVTPGNAVTLTVTAGADAALGAYSLSLIGVTDNLTNTTALTVVVAANVTEQYLPILAR